MKSDGLAVDFISKYTGLSLDEIKEKLHGMNLSLGMTFSEELVNAIQAEADRVNNTTKKEEA